MKQLIFYHQNSFKVQLNLTDVIQFYYPTLHHLVFCFLAGGSSSGVSAGATLNPGTCSKRKKKKKPIQTIKIIIFSIHLTYLEYRSCGLVWLGRPPHDREVVGSNQAGSYQRLLKIKWYLLPSCQALDIKRKD